MFQTNVVQKIKTHFNSVTFPEYCVVWEIMLKSVAETNNPRITIQYDARPLQSG